MKRVSDSTKIAGHAWATPWCDAGEGKPYIAQVSFDVSTPDRLSRRFLGELEWNGEACRAIVGVEELEEGTILETLENPSSRNDLRRFYLVDAAGEPEQIASSSDGKRSMVILMLKDRAEWERKRVKGATTAANKAPFREVLE